MKERVATAEPLSVNRWLAIALALSLTAMSALSLGCHTDMRDQHRHEPAELNRFFDDSRADRPLETGVIARGTLATDDARQTGRRDNQWLVDAPIELSVANLERGRERFEIFCAPCHGRSGHGDGMIAQRGFKKPATFHSDRLRAAPDGHFFDVITQGFGVMPSYRVQIPVDDRWAVVAYVRALQLSQHASADQLSTADRAMLPSANEKEASRD